MVINDINIGGKLRPVKFGWNTYALFGELTGIKISDMSEISNFKISHIIALIFAGLKEGARYKKQDFPFTQQDVGDWLDEDEGAVERIMEIFTDSLPKQQEQNSKNLKTPKQSGVK